MMQGLFGGLCSGFGGYGGYSWFGMILNSVFAIVLIVALVLLLVWLWRRVSPIRSAGPGAPQPTAPVASPKEILQIRYARGEITREQYRQMLDDLA
jgi:putative membrane protein